MPGEPAHIESFAVCDAVHDHYLLIDAGGNANGFAHDVVVHLRLQNGKVRVVWDGIEYGIAQDLIEAGIPSSDIVMPFAQPEPVAGPELAAA